MKNYLNEVFYQITENLDLTESQENSIKSAYNAVADWLNGEDDYKISIYPQGSMKLGTVVKPLDRDDYDVDMVCLLQKGYTYLSPADVKHIIGDRLKEHERYRSMLEPEGKRCWTLTHAESLNYHMDILPAIPDGQEAIKATHKENNSYRFIPTNPHGYAEWFKNRMRKSPMVFDRGNIERLPSYPRKTPLQKTIQLLKRHRDVMFQNNQDNSPASIIVTTIAANLYEQETDLVEFFGKVIEQVPTQIQNRSGILWVPNPVNPNENFADKWQSDPSKKLAFFDWIKKLSADYKKLLAATNSTELLNLLYAMFGQKVVDLANNDLGGFDEIAVALNERAEILPNDVQVALSVPYRQKAPWRLPKISTVRIHAVANNGTSSRAIRSNEPLNKRLLLSFRAIHNIQKPYTVKWQITNTGLEARAHSCLRGDFYDSDVGENGRKESTSYSGIHYVQCFIIKAGKCVAKSKEFIVNIR